MNQLQLRSLALGNGAVLCFAATSVLQHIIQHDLVVVNVIEVGFFLTQEAKSARLLVLPVKLGCGNNTVSIRVLGSGGIDRNRNAGVGVGEVLVTTATDMETRAIGTHPNRSAQKSSSALDVTMKTKRHNGAIPKGEMTCIVCGVKENHHGAEHGVSQLIITRNREHDSVELEVVFLREAEEQRARVEHGGVDDFLRRALNRAAKLCRQIQLLQLRAGLDALLAEAESRRDWHKSARFRTALLAHEHSL